MEDDTEITAEMRAAPPESVPAGTRYVAGRWHLHSSHLKFRRLADAVAALEARKAEAPRGRALRAGAVAEADVGGAEGLACAAGGADAGGTGDAAAAAAGVGGVSRRRAPAGARRRASRTRVEACFVGSLALQAAGAAGDASVLADAPAACGLDILAALANPSS
jgi:hypothetical protein